jgi:hypothetical protein
MSLAELAIKGSVKQLLDDAIARCGLSNMFDSTESEIRGPFDSLIRSTTCSGAMRAGLDRIGKA